MVYYAVFHMMEAALLLKELTFSKHSAVIANFNLHFIKTGIFHKNFSKSIERLFEQRQVGDYDVESGINSEEAQKNIDIALEIVKEIEKFLIKEVGMGS